MYIFTDEDDRVVLQVFQPTEKQKEEGIKVDSIPDPEKKEGKSPELYYDEENGLYYKYFDREPTNEEKINKLEQDNADIMLALTEMDGGKANG